MLICAWQVSRTRRDWLKSPASCPLSHPAVLKHLRPEQTVSQVTLVDYGAMGTRGAGGNQAGSGS